MNESTDTPSDDISISTMTEQEFGTQCTDYLNADIVDIVEVTDEDDSFIDIHEIKEDYEANQEHEVLVTHFRAINETRRAIKFERLNNNGNESTDSD